MGQEGNLAWTRMDDGEFPGHYLRVLYHRGNVALIYGEGTEW